MSQSICGAGECDRPVGPHGAKGLCPKHYYRHRMATSSPACSVPECEKRAQCRGLCPMHYQRWRLRGDPGQPHRERGKNVGPCSVKDCAQPSRKLGLCASHYAQQYSSGTPAKPFAYKWAAEKSCLVCGSSDWLHKRRRFCSQACQQLWFRHGGVPDNPSCSRCGRIIDLAKEGKRGRRKSHLTRLCRKCRSSRTGWMTPGELARRDGPACGICGLDVDLTLFAPDRMRASTDHIVPRARGGTNDPANQQLAHLWCNQVKSDRLDWRVPLP